MHYRIMLSFYGLIFAVAAFATSAAAVSLGKIDVASHLGESFYAEVPLFLDEGEVISTVYVELATPADYRILEVYRDQALNAIRADVENDSRGARIELTSRSAMDTPFFNLVLKVRLGRATHYKKYPVFLDLPRAAKPVKQASPLPSVTVEDAEQAPSVAAVAPVQPMVEEQVVAEETAAPTTTFKPYDSWARTSHYGPMVYGDTLYTVADRLRVDGRYTRNQVMVALFEKNRSKFEQDNVNLIQAGTHLDVPLAEEVERIRPEQAFEVIKDHNKRWKELVKQPRYAAVKEAQETRYSKRVRVGKTAAGVASAPVSGQQEQQAGDAEQAVSEMVDDTTFPDQMEGSVEGAATGQGEGASAAMLETVAKLQQENEALQTKLAETDARLAEMSAAALPEAQVAAEARIKKLELQLARLQSELDAARQTSVDSAGPDWLMLGGGALVLLLLGGGAGYLMRRERKHPAMVQSETAFEEAALAEPEPEASEEIDVEAVEEFSPDATAQMNAGDFENAFTDSIPDLTDEETGEMEAFNEDLEEEPDPNVDYLSEADVYMRYGMEDEAEKQVGLALKLRENNPDAHAKLVQIRKARGDDAGAAEAIATARTVLAGALLNNFEETITGADGGDHASSDDDSLDDTIPPGSLDVSDVQAEESLDDDSANEEPGDIEFGDVEETVPDSISSEAQQAGEAETDNDDAIDMGDIEWSPFDDTDSSSSSADDEETVVEAGVSDEETIVEDNISANLSDELPGFDNDEKEASVETSAEPAGEEKSSADSSDDDEMGDLDFDLSGLEMSDEDDASSAEKEDESSSLLQETGENVETASDSPEEPAEKIDMDDFDLSDLDFTDESTDAAPQAADEPEAEGMTSDLDKTVVMDWSKETLTSGGHELGGESGAGEIEFDSEEAPADVKPEEISEVEADIEEPEEPEENLSSLEFDLEDIDVDLDAPVESDDLDDFSSTIQTSIEEIKGSSDADKTDKSESSDPDIDDDALDLGSLDSDDDDGISAEGMEDGLDSLKDDNASIEDLIENDDDKDFDATMELDSLLSELSLDEDKDKKKDS